MEAFVLVFPQFALKLLYEYSTYIVHVQLILTVTVPELYLTDSYLPDPLLVGRRDAENCGAE